MMSPLNLFKAHGLYHRIHNLLILSLYLPCSTAAPVRDSSTSTNWLACLSALLIFSAVCLSAFKFHFVRHRKTSNLKGTPPASVEGQYVHWASKFLKLPAYTMCKNKKRCKGGFLIGFLGSPSFEIRPEPSEITLIYPGVDTSRTTQSHDLSGDSSTTHKSKKSAFSTGPMLLFSESYSQGRVKRHGSPSVALTKATNSWTLLPTQLSFDLGRLRRKKDVQSQISASIDDLPWPHNRLEHATLRLVKLYTEPETVLPLCKEIESVSGYSFPAIPAHSFAVTHLNRPHPLPISPLPSLPTHGPGNERTRNTLSPEHLGDHSYDNVPPNLVKPGRQNIRRASLSPNLSVIEEACHGSLPDCPSMLGLHQSMTLEASEQNKENLFCENLKTPPMTYRPYDTLKRREKTRSPLLRNRRSPPLGPSPLRSMILPDMEEDSNPRPKLPVAGEINDRAALRRRSIQYHKIGLGLPSIKLSPPSKDRIKPQDSTDNFPGGRGSVLDFLRELAEETKEWDESIVLDEGFKNMIQRSQTILGCASLENTSIKCSTSTPTLSGTARGNITPPRLVSFWIEDSPTP